MSEEKKLIENIKEEQAEDIEDKEEDLIDVNVAMLKAENIALSNERDELKGKLAVLKTKYGQAVDLIEDDTKSRIIAEIAPKTSVSDKLLALKSIEDLKAMKKVLDTAKVPAYRSGTPIVSVKDSPQAKLDNMFNDYKAKTWGKNK